MKLNFIIVSLLILLCTCINVSATTIDIIYPNENITTDIYYSTGNNMFSIQNNTLNTTNDITVMIIKNQYESTDIVDNPVKIIDYGILIFWIIMFIIVIISFIYIATRLFK